MSYSVVPICLALLALAGSSLAIEKISYAGYTLYRCIPYTENHLTRLQSLMQIKNAGIEFWTEPVGLNRSVDIMVSPEEQESLREKLRIWRVPTRTMMYDIGDVIERTSRVKSDHSDHQQHTYRDGTNMTRQRSDVLEPKNYYTNYQTYSIMEMKLRDMASKDSRVSLERLGLSTERRPLYLVKVSTDPSANKPVIFLDAGHHAREWISHATLFYILESLIRDDMPVVASQKLATDVDNLVNVEPDDSALKKLKGKSLSSHLEKYDFWFMPVVNPDGYEYTHTTNRLWRKTRSHSLICNGVDPNRNYPFHWRESGASSFSCDETYAGPRALSEPETRVIADILDRHQARIKMYLTLHAYSQLMLVPYGFARVYPEGYDQMKRVANVGMSALGSVRGTNYAFGPSSIMLYPAAGGSDDYALGHAKILLSYTIELPDSGRYGFLLPPTEIVPVGYETTVGISAMVDAI